MKGMNLEVMGSRLTLPQGIIILENCWAYECDPNHTIS